MDRRRLVTVMTSVALATWLGAGSALAADRDVAISGFTFSPSTVTINAGDSVTWTNSDAQAHTATGDGWNTGDLGNGQSGTIIFRTAGTFVYQCGIHPSMTGTVVVRAAAGGTTPPTDTVPPSAPGGDGVAISLAVLGVVMLVGTIVADRRLRARRLER